MFLETLIYKKIYQEIRGTLTQNYSSRDITKKNLRL
jgi:hypothetical protein